MSVKEENEEDNQDNDGYKDNMNDSTYVENVE